MAPGRIIIATLLLSAATGARADDTDDFVRARMSEFHVPGLSLAVLANGQVVKSAGYGFADRDRRLAATPETVYQIGSVSKQFTAAGMMLLVQEKRLRLDDRVGKHLETAPSSWSGITIRHLLTHTAGLRRESPAFSPFRIQAETDLVRALHSERLRFTPGQRWEYSNAGYVLLAEVIRHVAQQPWIEYLRQRIFTPAGMHATLPTNTPAALPNRAVGYAGTDNRKTADPWPALRPSGAFLSTVVDLARWDSVLYTDEILTGAVRRAMWSAVRLNDGTTAPYGLGWHVDTHRNRRRVWHSGRLPGFSAHVARYLDDRLAVIVLTNADDVDVAAIANGVAALHLRR